MSRKKTQPVILGPDGKPYVAPPKKVEPEPIGTVQSVDMGRGADRTYTLTFETLFGRKTYGGNVYLGHSITPRPALGETVEAQVAALTATFEGHGGEELPTPPRDLTTYADAFASAAKNCNHPDAEDVAYAKREMYCPTCRRYFKRPRSMWDY